MIDIQGRAPKPTVFSVIPDGAGVTIRVDSSHEPEFWLRISATRADLVQMIQSIDDAKACEEAEGRYQDAKRTITGL